MNNTTQAANNATTSQAVNHLSSIPDPRGLLSSVESSVMDKLTDWGYDPAHALFLFAGVLLLAFAVNYLMSDATKRMQGGNKWILFILVIIGILWWLEVI
jgi:hypothetical protein